MTDRETRATDLRWFIAMTLSGAEWDAHCGLLNRGIESFYPFSIEGVRRGRWRQPAGKPMFPGYVFAGLDPLGDGKVQNIERIKSTAGVKDIVRVGTDCIRIPVSTIMSLKQKAEAALYASIPTRNVVASVKVGDFVSIPEGPLMGMPVQIKAIDKSGRIEASLGTFGVVFYVSQLATGVRGRRDAA